jgi:hypothetical protein
MSTRLSFLSGGRPGFGPDRSLLPAGLLARYPQPAGSWSLPAGLFLMTHRDSSSRRSFT